MKRGWMIFLSVTLFLSGCFPNEKQQEIVVLAASSLSGALAELERVYEEEYPEQELSISYAASGKLRQQIERGAPADLFLSAGDREMDKLEEKGQILAETRTQLLTNQLMLIVPKGDSPIEGLADLRPEAVNRLAMGDPQTVPAGRYAREFLTETRRWQGLKSKMVFATHVRQVVAYVESGNADAGLVYRSDLKKSEGVKAVAIIPSHLHTPIVYTGAVTEGANRSKQAEHFLRWLKGKQAISIFQRYGFEEVADTSDDR
ncbi:MAG: molybdate ABC transporter substrate-binding protein [Firmicutes bacterium]|uniref:Molybdate transport system substrate-binding protein n=1 Tax=Melghirimyces thermohalophilus TaxID=1236220 RepID=A0A1G6I9E6_9BACL|nr:molybdate ABC transporter substrate-binding protein [Melghirimyces thermohalophilus]MDA8351629.1 molybdate ABC transporter substrate-binding protein [Bacillota bacterium]SDC02635.1 molybdate transport system substrate-binding protein [Melghirimyces thermohalophilus]